MSVKITVNLISKMSGYLWDSMFLKKLNIKTFKFYVPIFFSENSFSAKTILKYGKWNLCIFL
jgi:hypothetical protein